MRYYLKKISLNKINKSILISMIISIFVLSFYLRIEFMGNLASINFLFLISLVIYLLFNKKRINGVFFNYLVLLIIYIVIIDYLGNKNPIDTIVRNISMIILPIFLLTIKPKFNDYKKVTRNILILFNTFIIIIFVIGLLDPLINFTIMRFIGEHILTSINVWIVGNTNLTSYRYTSYMGHTLFTKELFIYFYFLNNIYARKYKEYLINKNIVTIISLVGVLLTASKTGLILILISILVTEVISGNIKNTMYTIFIFIFSYMGGFFNYAIQRLQNGSLTTGRNESWEYIKSKGIIESHIFYGKGEFLSDIVTKMVGQTHATAGLEYPFRIFLYKYGLVCTIIIISSIFLYPLIYLMKKREYYMVFAFIIKFIDISTYNGLVYKADNMILFVFFTYMLMFFFYNDKNIYDEEKI